MESDIYKKKNFRSVSESENNQFRRTIEVRSFACVKETKLKMLNKGNMVQDEAEEISRNQ